MDSLKSILEDLRERKGAFFVLVAVVVIVAISIIASIGNAQHEFLAKSPTGMLSGSDTVSSYVQGASSTSTSGSDQTSGSQSTASQTPTVPFKVSSVALESAKWSCQDGKVLMTITSARVAANSSGGTFAWQLEITGSEVPYSPLKSYVSISKNQTSYQLIGGNPGYLYSSTDARDGQSVRVHITSPNDVVSAPFAVPANAQESCAPTQPTTDQQSP